MNKYRHIITIVLIFICGYLIDRYLIIRGQLKSKESIIKEKQDSLAYERNEKGQEVAKKNAALASMADIRESYASELRQITNELDIRDRDLKAFMKTQFSAKGSGTTVIHNHYEMDTTGAQVVKPAFSIEDGYLALTGTVQDSVINYEYSYTDQILAAFHYDKKGIFGKRELKWSGRLSNPNARITSSTDVVVDEYKDKRWCVTVGASYTPFSNIPVQPSITVGYALFKF